MSDKKEIRGYIPTELNKIFRAVVTDSVGRKKEEPKLEDVKKRVSQNKSSFLKTEGYKPRPYRTDNVWEEYKQLRQHKTFFPLPSSFFLRCDTQGH